jgi:hypothetical protein
MKEKNAIAQYRIDERTEIAGDIKDRGTDTEDDKKNNDRRTGVKEDRETGTA